MYGRGTLLCVVQVQLTGSKDVNILLDCWLKGRVVGAVDFGRVPGDGEWRDGSLEVGRGLLVGS